LPARPVLTISDLGSRIWGANLARGSEPDGRTNLVLGKMVDG